MSHYRFFLNLLLAIAILSTIIEARSRPLLMIRKRSSPYIETVKKLQELIENEQEKRAENFEEKSIIRRFRKSIPDGYFDEFTVNDLIDRHRRGQPITDYTDEFSADPFEFPLRSMKKPRRSENE